MAYNYFSFLFLEWHSEEKYTRDYEAKTVPIEIYHKKMTAISEEKLNAMRISSKLFTPQPGILYY